MSTSSGAPEPNTYVEAFARGLAVIKAFDADHATLTLSEVAARADVSRAAARRLLLTLCHLGYAVSLGRAFQLTPKVMQLGYSYLSGWTLPEILQPYLAAVAEKTAESCSAGVLDDLDVVYIARASTRRIMSVDLSVGSRLPAWATAHGRVLLAQLDDDELNDRLRRSALLQHTPYTITEPSRLAQEIRKVRDQGYCFVNQELELSLTAIAMPLRDKSGKVTAAVNLAGHAERNTKERMIGEFLPILRETVDEINVVLRVR